jgi:aryl-alcohol dehydrogenase-like predicted oxidoreductase
VESSDAIFEGVPRVIVGTERLGSVIPGLGRRTETFRYLDALVEAGCTAFDVAASYQLGGTERMLGAWMRARGNRHRLFFVGKGAHPYPIIRPDRLTARDLQSDLEDSLRRLDTDRIDLYLVHRDSAGAPLEPIAEALGRFVREGKIRAWGVSNWHHARVGALADLANDRGLGRLAASSPQFSVAHWARPEFRGTVSISADPYARTFYAKRGMPVLAWSPLGRGFLAGARGGAYDTSANSARRTRLVELAKRRAASPIQIALAWLFSQPFMVYAITSSSSAVHMTENLAASTIRLTPGERDWLESG